MPFQAITPNPAGFGSEQDAYLKSLYATTGDPTADAINRLNLGYQAAVTPDNYLQALREAQQYNAEGAHNENQKDATVAYLTNIAGITKEGAGGAISVPDSPYLHVDPNRFNTADAEALNVKRAAILKDAGSGAYDISRSGSKIPNDYLAGILTPAGQRQAPTIKEYVNPEDQAKLAEAEAAKEQAKAANIRAVKNHEGAGKDTITYVLDRAGNRVPISEVVQTPGSGAPKPGGGSPASPNHSVIPKTIINNQGHVVPNPAYVGP